MSPITLLDYRELAKEKISQEIFDYIDGGACDEITTRMNHSSFSSIGLLPLCLRDVSNTHLSTTLLGQHLAFPLMIAPTAFHQLLNDDGEKSTATAAKICNIPMIVSMMSSLSLEEIAKNSGHDNLWLQIYILKDRELTVDIIKEAERVGYKAILLTVGAPVMGKRDRDIRNQYKIPSYIIPGNFRTKADSSTITRFIAAQLDSSLTWQDIDWLKSKTALPIILKGIINPLDAREACQFQVSGIVVSNHGGRQLDTCIPTIAALPKITEIVDNKMLVLLDGGIRRGTDILKAIALGADAVLLGRPTLWALAVNGQAGLTNMLTILKEELEVAMKLCGCNSIETLKKMAPDITSINNLTDKQMIRRTN